MQASTKPTSRQHSSATPPPEDSSSTQEHPCSLQQGKGQSGIYRQRLGTLQTPAGTEHPPEMIHMPRFNTVLALWGWCNSGASHQARLGTAESGSVVVPSGVGLGAAAIATFHSGGGWDCPHFQGWPWCPVRILPSVEQEGFAPGDRPVPGEPTQVWGGGQQQAHSCHSLLLAPRNSTPALAALSPAWPWGPASRWAAWGDAPKHPTVTLVAWTPGQTLFSSAGWIPAGCCQGQAIWRRPGPSRARPARTETLRQVS